MMDEPSNKFGPTFFNGSAKTVTHVERRGRGRRTSQPLLHSLLYEDTDPEREKYLSVVDAGFWTFINDAAGREFDLDDADQKQVLKEKVFGQVFYGRVKMSGRKGIYAQAFEKEFPVLTRLIAEHKQSSHKLLPREMQYIESGVVMEVVANLSTKLYPLITIHDAIVTTCDDAIEVSHAIRDAFSEINLRPKLKMEVLEP